MKYFFTFLLFLTCTLLKSHVRPFDEKKITIANDNPKAILLVEYERPAGFEKKELVRKLCIIYPKQKLVTTMLNNDDGLAKCTITYVYNNGEIQVEQAIF